MPTNIFVPKEIISQMKKAVDKKHIAVLVHGTIKRHFSKLAECRLSSIRLNGQNMDIPGTIADLPASYEILVPSSRKALTLNLSGLKCKVSLLIREPVAIQK